MWMGLQAACTTGARLRHALRDALRVALRGAMRRLPDLPLRPAALPEASFLHCVGRDGPCRVGECTGLDGLDAVVQLAVASSSSVAECRAAVHGDSSLGTAAWLSRRAAFTSTISPAWIGRAFSANPSARP